MTEDELRVIGRALGFVLTAVGILSLVLMILAVVVQCIGP